jgi:hypothetical protein
VEKPLFDSDENFMSVSGGANPEVSTSWLLHHTVENEENEYKGVA